MLEEQKNTIDAFRKNIDRQKFGQFIIYGTGIHAKAVVQSCKEYSILGIMDLTKTGQTFCELPILSQEEILEKQVKKIIIVARPAVHTIIYKRIREWCIKNQIEVFDIYGINIEEKLQEEVCDSPYFRVSYEQLLKEIDTHEIISFDIFDTILMRKVYEPADVFLLVDAELETETASNYAYVKELHSCPFSEMRKTAEQELLKEREPNLYEIYRHMGEKYHLSQEVCDFLMERELAKEHDVLVVRKKMKECMEYCKVQKKPIFFVSDMYLPSKILKGFLEELGITGYEEILVSCEYQVSKPKGLFSVLKEKARGASYLHIGDNEKADYQAARKYGIDAFLIMPAMRMLEISTYKSALTYLGGLGSRAMLGMLAAEIFNNPFALYASQGKPSLKNPEAFGYSFIGPFLLSYLVWLLSILDGKEEALLLFSSRDGWIVQQAYHILSSKWEMKRLPQDIYFMISRKVVLQAEEEPEGEGSIAYKRYLDSLELEKYKEIYFFDFMSRGTCQTKLEKIIGRKITGLYFQKSISGEKEKDGIKVKAYFKETSAHGNELRIFAMCDFLECIMTSYQPSFIQMESDGSFGYDIEKRSQKQIDCLKEIHRGMLDYCECFGTIMGRLPKHIPPAECCDEILKYTGTEYSDIDIPALKEFMLDDWLGGDKNTGQDVLL